MSSQPIKKIEVYKTISVLSLALLFAYFYFEEIWLLYGLAFLLFLVLFLFPIAKMIHHLWMLLAIVLAWINTKILLSLIFFLVLTPLALLQRRFSKSSFNSPQDNDLESYFETPDRQEFKPDDFKQSW